MPPFEEFIDVSNVPSRVIDEGDKWFHIHQSTDVTGNRVESYCNLVILSHKIYSLTRLMPFWIPGHRFAFHDERDHKSMRKLRVI